ncbi:lipoprotein [compost metagenome]
MTKKILLLILSFSVFGCASYLKRQQCEQINWFDHGKKIALRGQWLNSDKMVQECRKVEAEMSETQLDQGFKSGMGEYCSPQGAYSVGKSGKSFSREFCEGPGITAIMNQHQQGIRDYCAKSNGYQAGASGEKYKNVCSPEMEKTFLPEYRKGRKKFVEAQIKYKEGEISNLEKRRSAVAFEAQNIEYQQRSLESQRNYIQSQLNFAQSSNNLSQVSNLQSQANSVDSEISSKRNLVYAKQNETRSIDEKVQALNKEISEFRTELPSLEQ